MPAARCKLDCRHPAGTRLGAGTIKSGPENLGSTGNGAGAFRVVRGARLCDKVRAVKMQRAWVLLAGLIGLGVFAGCGGEDDPPDPLATRAGFCGEWAKNACNQEVITSCAATGSEACRDAQQEHCLSLVPADGYQRGAARTCLDAVRGALTDARLTSEEAGVVLRGEGACSFSCVELADGGCVEPTVVSGGGECSAEDAVCDEGFYCNGDNCIARRAAGRECSAEIPCLEDLKCVGPVDAQLCEERASDGAACENDDDCASGICGRGTNLCAARVTLSDAEPVCSLFR